MINHENEQLRRIAHMTKIYEQGCAAVADTLRAAERYQALRGELQELEEYYLHGEWMKDFDDDNAGRIPKDMNRGILTEDAIWDLLTDQARMCKILQQMIDEGK